MRIPIAKVAAAPLVLLIALPVAAQNSSGGKEPSQARNQSQNDRRSGGSNQAIRRHYLAGFVRGYYSGFADGMNDYLLVVRGGGQGGQAASDRTDSSDRQSQSLRDRLRENSRSRMSQQRGSAKQGRRESSQASRRSASTKQQIHGEVLATKRTRLKNDDQIHLVLLVADDQGNRRIVDAGPDSQARQLSIKKGDQVRAQGRMQRTRDGVPVLISERVGKQDASTDRQRSPNQQRQRSTRDSNR